jgi:hypothetical protein
VETDTTLPVRVNRAPVLTLWAAIVSERVGNPPDTALTLGRFVAGSRARAMARRLGIMDEAQETVERRVRAAVTEPWLRTRSVRGRVGLRRFRLTCQRMHQAERMTPLLSILNTPI